MAKTYEEINEKIRRGKAVVVTAEEMIDVVRERGASAAARDVDVVTTGTFGPMCSSGAVLNVGHTTPRMKIQHARLNGVEAYGGLAAVDLYVGATQVKDGDPLNGEFPGRFEYGGGHVIEALVRGEDVELVAESYGTDCYPRRALEAKVRLRDLTDAVLFNPRNAYQNYNVAVNAHGEREIYTYLGVLRPSLANATFCSAGQLSPLLNDPRYRTIGIGTRIFLGGGVGYVTFAGTQHNPDVPRTEGGAPMGGAGTLMVVGDLKRMSADFLRGVSMVGYGTSLAVGIGVPIPILDEELALSTAVSDAELYAPVIDYSRDYPENRPAPLCLVSYADLRRGAIEVLGRRVPAASLSSYAKAREIALALKAWIDAGTFTLGRPVEPLPGARTTEGGSP
jgi:uncharacterized protein (DUF39 family)